MEDREVYSLYFTGTGTSRTYADAVAGELGEAKSVDLTPKDLPMELGMGAVAVFAAPVFGGRIPAAAVRRIRALAGNGAAAVALAVYGNRAYEDALLELKDLLEERGFRVVAAAALIAQHSMAPTLAAGRPDEADLKAAREIGRAVPAKLATMPQREKNAALQVPGDRPYRLYNGVPFHPSAGKNCVRCGLCAQECPVGAIPAVAPERTDEKRCISCMRCVAVCPQRARALGTLQEKAVTLKLAKACAERKAPELFL